MIKNNPRVAGVLLGIGMGIALAVALGNIAIGIGVGFVFVTGSVVWANQKKEEEKQ